MAMADGTVYRLITDHLGSVRLVVNVSDGTVTQRMDYDAFGRVLRDTNPDFQPLGFAGGFYDDDTKLVRFGARDYDAFAGRWTAKDSILFDGDGPNLYAYAESDPLNYYDQLGESKTKGILDGDDPYLKRYKDLAKRNDRAGMDRLFKQAEREFKTGKISKSRRRKIRAWNKLAKSGRLLRLFLPAFLPCLDTLSCACLKDAELCIELCESL
jgi:RHS repeat-associated protein